MLRALVIAAALAAGCRDPGLARLREIRDEVCACKTSACGEAAMKHVPEHEVESDHRSQQIAREMLDCLAKLYLADRPSTDPDAEAPAAPEAPAPTGAAGSAGSAAPAGAAGSAGSAAPAGAAGSAGPAAPGAGAH